jgi:DDE superfamily endonuclease
VVVTLAHLRRNLVQWELAETYLVSQSTISRAISAVTPLAPGAGTGPLRAGGRRVGARTAVPRRRDAASLLVLGGSPAPVGGKHETTGMNVQVVCTLDGELVWISDPIQGARHDVFCLDESGALHTLDPRDWTGDKGYVGRGMVTPTKKIPELELLDWQKSFNGAPSMEPAQWSSVSSPTSRTGESSTRTTDARSTASPRPSQPLSDCCSTRLRE